MAYAPQTRRDARTASSRVPREHPEGLLDAAFRDASRRRRATVRRRMRQVLRAGEKCFVDYSGVLAAYVDPRTGDSN